MLSYNVHIGVVHIVNLLYKCYYYRFYTLTTYLYIAFIFTQMDLTSEQKSVLSLCQQGYNVFLTGQAGTGKTFLLKEIIHHLQVQHGVSQVGITATTGKAALPLSGLTLHSFFSIGLGKQSAYKLLDLLFSRDDVTKKIKDLKVLVIDEVSNA